MFMMKKWEIFVSFGIVTALFVTLTISGFAQTVPAPLLQDIKVANDSQPNPTSTPLIQKTGSSQPTAASSIKTLFPALAEVDIPGYSGVLVESLDGKTVLESNADLAFNPASNVKVATSYAVLKTFGPDFRFLTSVYTDGVIDKTTGTLAGNLYVSGKDPIFGYEHAIAIANELNRMGVRQISGDLIVTDNFAMNYSNSPMRSADQLYSTMDATKRSPTATRVWLAFLRSSGKYSTVTGVPDITIAGAPYVQPIPNNLRLLFTHQSTKLRDIVKATMCYSNNFLAERLGDMIGGPYAVARVVQQGAAIPQNEFSIQTASGLGINRVTPNAMMRLLRALRSELDRYNMDFADIMPVAGVDKGTLENRFDTDFATGSVVGKTGTLGRTDSGVSALSGEINTQNGKFLFVIFNQRGSVSRFRTFQNYFVSLLQGQFGGAAPIGYQPTPLDTLLSRTLITETNGKSY